MELFATQETDASGQAGAVPDISGQDREPNISSADWLSVPEAVAYCEAKGLRRNIKTVRRWAARSLARPENAELSAREQDTPNGFRHIIERGSLDRKISQELAFEANRVGAGLSGYAPSGPDLTADARPRPVSEVTGDTDAPMPAPVRTQPEPAEPVRKLEVTSLGDDFLKDQVTQKDVQIGELNDQLKRRDEQIMTLHERDRETNLLINGLQQTLLKTLGLEGSSSTRGDQAGGTAGGVIDRSDV
ncbi:MAG: hypothetical protein AAFQ17_02980 [Pseudomonadota bacterium]